MKLLFLKFALVIVICQKLKENNLGFKKRECNHFLIAILKFNHIFVRDLHLEDLPHLNMISIIQFENGKILRGFFTVERTIEENKYILLNDIK